MVNLGGDPEKVNPASPGRSGCRPFRAGRLLRAVPRCEGEESGDGVSEEHGEVQILEVGPAEPG